MHFMHFRRPEVWMLTTVFAIAGLLLAFGHIAEEVLEGDATKFDQTILFFFRSAPANILSAKQLMGGTPNARVCRFLLRIEAPSICHPGWNHRAGIIVGDNQRGIAAPSEETTRGA